MTSSTRSLVARVRAWLSKRWQNYLDAPYHCDKSGCGCMGATNRDYWEHKNEPF